MALSEKWKATVDAGLTDAKWDAYDAVILSETNDYNSRLATTPGFRAFDWRLFKAMAWVESGGPGNAAWGSRPMQIGNPGDPGITILRTGGEGSKAVMSDALARDLVAGNINTPALNVRAGIAYAVTRLAKTAIQSVDDPNDATVRDHVVVAGDTFDKIARTNGTTIPSLQATNPGVTTLAIGRKVKFRKASMRRVVTGWLPVTTANLAARYNVGDPDYQQKLEYVMGLFAKLKR